MGRILFFLLLGIALYVGFKLLRVGQRRNDGPAGGKTGEVSEPMVRCAHCGLNVPRSEAVAGAGRWYCSESHRRLEHADR